MKPLTFIRVSWVKTSLKSLNSKGLQEFIKKMIHIDVQNWVLINNN
jgi:hypothetical protein